MNRVIDNLWENLQRNNEVSFGKVDFFQRKFHYLAIIMEIFATNSLNNLFDEYLLDNIQILIVFPFNCVKLFLPPKKSTMQIGKFIIAVHTLCTTNGQIDMYPT